MWAIYALLSAFFIATTDPIAKRILSVSDEYIVGWGTLFSGSIFLSIYCFLHKVAPLNPQLLKTILFVVPIEILATVLYYRAIKLTDISLSVPFLALTPVFATLTAYILLGERTRPAGIVGIVLITIGVYSLNIKEARHGITNPIKAILLNKGSLYMALVALLFSITATVSKRAMLLSSPESIPFIYTVSIVIVMFPIILYRYRRGKSIAPAEKRGLVISLIMLGFFFALSSIFYFKSVSLANVAYAVSIKRLSLLMSVGYGWLFFRERDIHIRLISTFCMFAGVVLILTCR